MSKIPDRLGHYRLLRLVGVGNACQIWEATNEASGGKFAIKVLPASLNQDKEEAAHLRNEFDIAQNFKHPNVVRVYEHHVEAGMAYLVLELCPPLNLKQAMRQEMPRVQYHLSKIIEQAASALYYIHGEGVVHCDVKPDNFLLGDDALIKLIDFTIARKIPRGIAKLFGGRGKVRGTRSYMSPEQIRGESLDPRSDLYSFACLLYELVTGKPPYTGNSPNELLTKHLRASIPWAPVHNDNLTSEMADLIRRCMAKEAKQRPDSLWEFLKEFRAIRLFKVPPKPPEASGETPAAT